MQDFFQRFLSQNPWINKEKNSKNKEFLGKHICISNVNCMQKTPDLLAFLRKQAFFNLNGKTFSYKIVDSDQYLRMVGSLTKYCRSSRPEVFSKKGVLRNFTGKHLCQSLFFDKVAGLRPGTCVFL